MGHTLKPTNGETFSGNLLTIKNAIKFGQFFSLI